MSILFFGGLSLSLSPTAGRVSKSARPASAAKGDARDVRGTAVHRQSVPYRRTEIRYPHLRPRHVLCPVKGKSQWTNDHLGKPYFLAFTVEKVLEFVEPKNRKLWFIFEKQKFTSSFKKFILLLN